jgi:hypothetical protein
MQMVQQLRLFRYVMQKLYVSRLGFCLMWLYQIRVVSFVFCFLLDQMVKQSNPHFL